MGYSFILRSIISSDEVLSDLVKFFGERFVSTFPNEHNYQLLNLKLKTVEQIDKETKVIVGVLGFRELRMHLLKMLFKYSHKAPVAYIERVIEDGDYTESAIVLDKNKKVFEVNESKTAIAKLFKSGLIPVSSELKAYIGSGTADPKKLIKYRKYEAKSRGKTFLIQEDVPDVGWFFYVVEKNGSYSYDYLQDDYNMCRRQGHKQFNVPMDAWKEVKSKSTAIKSK